MIHLKDFILKENKKSWLNRFNSWTDEIGQNFRNYFKYGDNFLCYINITWSYCNIFSPKLQMFLSFQGFFFKISVFLTAFQNSWMFCNSMLTYMKKLINCHIPHFFKFCFVFEGVLLEQLLKKGVSPILHYRVHCQ